MNEKQHYISFNFRTHLKEILLYRPPVMSHKPQTRLATHRLPQLADWCCYRHRLWVHEFCALAAMGQKLDGGAYHLFARGEEAIENYGSKTQGNRYQGRRVKNK